MISSIHISAAVVYGFVKYIRATGDKSILSGGGMETILECARFYRSLLLRYADKTKYEIHDAVGPDEYHERVNNNAYTNRMAKLVFDTAANLLEEYVKEYPASAGGAWIAAVNGFAGIKERDGELVREPSLPDRWKEMSFKIMFRNILYMIEIKDGIGAMTEL